MVYLKPIEVVRNSTLQLLVFADVTIASAILDRVLHHATVVSIKGESYRLKERKEYVKQKHLVVNMLFGQGQN